jgi:4-oxalomesaconate hydratase
MAAQSYLQEYYAQRAEHRGNHARKVTGNSAIRHAEAFHRLLPNVVSAL